MDTQTGSSQSVTASRKYDAYGKTRSSSGTWQGPFGHAGGFGYQSNDRSGLQLLGHRYYDPETGRFLSTDPIKDGMNWQSYGGGIASPLAMFDPDGLKLRTWIQGALDILGIFDPFGVCDAINGIVHLCNGEKDLAILSFIGIIPLIGDFAKLGKIG